MSKLEMSLSDSEHKRNLVGYLGVIDSQILLAKLRARELLNIALVDGTSSIMSYLLLGYSVTSDNFNHYMRLNLERLRSKCPLSLRPDSIDERLVRLNTRYNNFAMRVALKRRLRKEGKGYTLSKRGIEKDGKVVGVFVKDIAGEYILVEPYGYADLKRILSEVDYVVRPNYPTKT